MKTISIVLVLIIGIMTVSMAQEVDSIVVTYNNQHTTIPVPAFGKQTIIKMADSIQMIEINISRRGINDISKQALYPANIINTQKLKNKAKWFSEVEVGYTLSVPYYYSPSGTSYLYREGGNFQGYKLGLSVREKTRNISNKTAFITGFKLGYEQSFRNVYVQVTGDSPVYRSSFFKMLFPFAGKNKITAFGLPTFVSYGANFIFGYSFITRKNNSSIESVYDNGLLFLEPFLGIEINKLGLRIASSRNLAPDMSFYNPVKAVNSFSLTYRIF